MANLISLILVILTLATGIFWCLNRLFFFLKNNCKYKEIDLPTGENKLKRKKNISKRFQSKWIETISSFFPVLAVVLIIRSFIYEPFQIPSGSMMPTLLIGDFILVKKFAYGIKDPIFQKTLIKTGYPKRGDIVVFKYPKNPRLDYIKRIIGLPGDKIIYNPIKKEITIQKTYSSPHNTCCTSNLPITYSNIEPSDFIQTFILANNKEVKSSFLKLSNKEEVNENSIRLENRQENLDNISHYILTIPTIQDPLWMYYQQSGQKLATWIVPKGKYFMMGDNRDNSADSRYWGFVPEKNLVGKAVAIWISLEKQEGKWPISFRFHRIGKIY